MAEDDGSRRPSQPSTPVNPAGVGSSASNRSSPRAMVSPSILQEILESGNQPLIDDALEQWDPADMGRLLSTLPSPVRPSPAGVGSATSNRSSPSPAVPQTPTGRVATTVTAGVGAGGGGSSGGSSSSSSSRSRRTSPPSGGVSGRSGTPPVPAPAPVPVGASTPRGRPRQGQKEPRGRGRGRGGGRGRGRPNPSPTLPWTPPSPSQQGSPQAPLNQADLQRRLRMLLQDQEQIAAGRRIANITTTNSIVTSYKEGGRPSVQSKFVTVFSLRKRRPCRPQPLRRFPC